MDREGAVLSTTTETAPTARTWNEILGPYKRPNAGRSTFQLVSTSLLFFAGWAAMAWSLGVSYWLTLLLAFPTAGLLVRLFIIQHDCGHGAFFRSGKLNNAVGAVLGVLTLTPYQYWRRCHAIHHATSGDLDRREMGDITTLTVDEYLALSFWGRLKYRLYRNMFVLLVVGPFFEFAIRQRLPLDTPMSWKREWMSVLGTNVSLAAVLLVMAQTLGLGAFALVHMPVLLISGGLGIWLFYVQHQFEDTYWEHHEGWDYYRAGIEGSSYYDLPAVLHWFTGNIGYHHVHHLSSRIPNYRLRECLEENPELSKVTRITVRESLRCARLKLWDEKQRRLIGFRELRRLRQAQPA
jgi:omega-6 fatty acid desaturase (delta-12 desaturase)